jgi:putative nucleotidyltransferase with HDIG domain
MEVLILILLLLLIGVGGALAWSRRRKTPVSPIPVRSKEPEKKRDAVPEESVPPAPSSPDIQVKKIQEWHRKIDEARYSSPETGFHPASFESLGEERQIWIMGKLSQLLPLSPISLQLTNLLRNPQSSTKEIAGIAVKDPVLSARLLRAVNSAYFGLRYEVTSIGRAVVLLGYNQVRALLFEDVLRKNLPSQNPDEKERANKIWLHSMVVSACAGELGHHVRSAKEIDWGTLGLLHDIGKYFFFLLEKKGSQPGEEVSLFGEEKRYGLNHAVLGGMMARNWKLPEEIAFPIGLHHHPAFFDPDHLPSAHRLTTSVIHLADHLAKVLGFAGDTQEIYPLRPPYLQHLRIGPDLKALVTPGLIQEIEKVVRINEGTGFLGAVKEEEKKEGRTDSTIEGAEKEDFWEMECPRCGYEAQISRDLVRPGGSLTWVCPGCKEKVVKSFADLRKGRE